MDTIGIIIEYNPFHNGHLYQINKVKEQFPNSKIIVILDTRILLMHFFSELLPKDTELLSHFPRCRSQLQKPH